jgi:hypothetical protein
MKTAPVCPKCGKTPDKISERPTSSGQRFLSREEGGAKATICVYRCMCGTMFSRTEQQDGKPSPSASGPGAEV